MNKRQKKKWRTKFIKELIVPFNMFGSFLRKMSEIEKKEGKDVSKKKSL